jgi:hypothetical protein
MLLVMALDPKNAHVCQVHVDNEPASQHRKITSESGTYRMSDRVLVLVDGVWRRGHVDHRAPSGPGGVVMITLEQ